MDLLSHSSSFLLPSLPASLNHRAKYALIVLNQRIPSFMHILWKHAELRVFADGGANRMHDEMPLFFPNEHASSVLHRYKPDVIKGDMDSIRPEVLRFYAGKGTEIINSSDDQDTTDLHKCVDCILSMTPEASISNLCILVTGALGGRFDHEAGNINVLYLFPNIRIILLSEECLFYLLPRTHHHTICVQPSIEGPHCGLIPIGMPSGRTKTSGLQWDLDDAELRFGGLVSTSNLVRSKTVTVQSDSDIIWTISIKAAEVVALSRKHSIQ